MLIKPEMMNESIREIHDNCRIHPQIRGYPRKMTVAHTLATTCIEGGETVNKFIL